MIKLCFWIGLIIILQNGFSFREMSGQQRFAMMDYFQQQPAPEQSDSSPKPTSRKNTRRYSQKTPLNSDTVHKGRSLQDTPSPIQSPEQNSQKKS